MAITTKRDRMLTLKDGRPVQDGYVPAAFFLHFDPEFHYGLKAVEKHLQYFRHTGMDFVKIQYEKTFPVERDIRRPGDWQKLPRHGEDFYAEPLSVVEGLVKAAKDEALILVTLYSPYMCAGHAAGGDKILTEYLNQDPEGVKPGLEIATESLMIFVDRCIDLGVDGFYASTQGGEAGRFDDDSLFDRYIKPYDLALMRHIDEACEFNILHVCDYHRPYDSMDRFLDYPGHLVSCPSELTTGPLPPTKAAEIFDRPVMGGLDRHGVLASDEPEEVSAEAKRVLADAPSAFVLGADCTVPPDTAWDNLKAAVDAAHGG